MSNFKFPYFSRNIGEFWRRWHISLSTWFRDYLYIPLGGSQEGKWKSIRNIFIIFLVSGFLHGANWTFIFWGLFHSILFLPSFIFKTNRKYNTSIIAENTLLPSPKEFIQVITTFTLVTVGWVFFRSETITDAFSYLNQMISVNLMPQFYKSYFIYYIIPFTFLEFIDYKFNFLVKKTIIVEICLSIILTIILNHLGGKNQFIYFQF